MNMVLDPEFVPAYLALIIISRNVRERTCMVVKRCGTSRFQRKLTCLFTHLDLDINLHEVALLDRFTCQIGTSFFLSFPSLIEMNLLIVCHIYFVSAVSFETSLSNPRKF